jgi:tripartite ATP-independent transporter DctM subunit
MVALLFAAFLMLVVLRVPIGFALLTASLATIVAGGLPPVLVAQKMFEGLTPFPILAIPLFYLAGAFATQGGIGTRLINLSVALVGRFRGGLAQVDIVQSMVFAGISGSSVADTVGSGSVLIPQEIRNGYPPEFAVALTAITSTMGVIIPPSILAVIYGAYGNVSIGALFLGGAIPGLAIGFGLMLLVYVMARLNGYPTMNLAGNPGVARTLLAAALPMGVPAIVIGGVVAGVFTATESAAVAVVYTVVIAMLVHRELSPRGLWNQLNDMGAFVAMPLMMTAAATLFGWLLSYYSFPDTLVGAAQYFGATQLGVLGFVVTLFIVLGCFLDSIPAIIMFLPTVQKLGDSVGIDPVHMGVVVILVLAWGLVTPPYGVCLLVAAQIGQIPARRAFRFVALFSVPILLVIAVSVLWADFSLWLPRTLLPEAAR